MATPPLLQQHKMFSTVNPSLSHPWRTLLELSSAPPGCRIQAWRSSLSLPDQPTSLPPPLSSATSAAQSHTNLKLCNMILPHSAQIKKTVGQQQCGTWELRSDFVDLRHLARFCPQARLPPARHGCPLWLSLVLLHQLPLLTTSHLSHSIAQSATMQLDPHQVSCKSLFLAKHSDNAMCYPSHQSLQCTIYNVT